MDDDSLIPHLFRTEFRKIVAVLTRHFGFRQIEIAEDIASETFMTAMQAWGLDGIPAYPTSWLYQVAKNKARNFLKRENLFKNKIAPDLKKQPLENADICIDLSPGNIIDSQLQMMFAICNPAISTASQVGLALQILCGFSISEIADAFLTNPEAISKRLYRARERLRSLGISIGYPSPSEIDERIELVLKTIYLLFNEGYYSKNSDRQLRKELCLEAIRLCTQLIENRQTNRPAANALLSLMCFHSSRFEAREDEYGEIVLYDQQDANNWNMDFISKGGYFLRCSAQGERISKYHLEAGIAYWNTQKEDSKDKWTSIVKYYDQILQLEYSPIAALNRAYAISKTGSCEIALKEALKLNLSGNLFYHMLLGVLYTETDQEKAKESFTAAYKIAKTDAEKRLIQKRLDCLLR